MHQTFRQAKFGGFDLKASANFCCCPRCLKISLISKVVNSKPKIGRTVAVAYQIKFIHDYKKYNFKTK